jgi:ornithine cyclodeaminase/alanine dehydrogenase-like protein (mu-crystallin family)
MVLVLKKSNVQSILTMKDGIRLALAEEGFVHHARRRTMLAPRMVMKLESEAGNLRILAALVPDVVGFDLKTPTGTPDKHKAESTYFAMLYFDVENDLQS